MTRRPFALLLIAAVCAAVVGCTLSTDNAAPPRDYGALDSLTLDGELGVVDRVIDGDTIDVSINGVITRVRYIGVNTPERNEPCSDEATAANRALVDGQTVTLVRDASNTDRYDRLLRYVYIRSGMVNEQLVIDGYAEAVEYPPDTRHTARFRDLEADAASAGRGCHATGIFDDGTLTR